MKHTFKRLFIIVLTFLLGSPVFAQTPTSFQYQAILRDASGQVLASQDVEISIAILQGSASGTEVFNEIHLVTTNNFGLANLQIGSVNQTGMEAIDWGAGPYFVEVSVDGIVMGTSQLLSVPFAMHALTVENDAVDDADADPENEIQDISLEGHELSITYGSTLTLPDEVDDADTDPANELQVLSIKGDTIFLSDGGFAKLPAVFNGDFNNLANIPPNLDTDASDDFDGQYSSLAGAPENVSKFTNDAGFITSPDDADSDPTNEFQFLFISNDTVFLTNGGFIKLPVETDPLFSAWDKSTGVAISESQITDLKHFTSDDENDPVFNASLAKQITSSDTSRWGEDSDPNNELQFLSISNDTIYLTNGGYAKLPAGFDGSFTSLTNIPSNLDTDFTDDFDGQYSSLTGAPQNISEFNNDAGYITNPDDADADPTNELQDISLDGTDLSISEGSTVDLSVLQDGTGTDDQLLSWLINNRGEMKIGIQNGNSLDMDFVKDGTGWDEWADNEDYLAKWGSGGFLERGSIFDNGNIGIGTTTPSKKLDVIANSNLSVIKIQNTNSSGYSVIDIFDNNGIAKGAIGYANLLAAWKPGLTYIGSGNNPLVLLTEGTERLRIDNINGNVGIGTGTPGAKLEVAGQVKITGGSPGAGKVLTSDADGLASWENESDPVWVSDKVNYYTKTEIDALPHNTLDQAYDEGGAGAGRIITADAGAVKIEGDGGLKVEGTVLSSRFWGVLRDGNTNSISDMLILGHSPTGTPSYGIGTGILFQSKNSGGGTINLARIAGLYTGYAETGIVFQTNSSVGDLSEKMRLTHDGRLGIGETDPDAKLEINGQVKITGGSPGADKVLTSDTDGLATWEEVLDNSPTNELNTSVVLNGTNLETTDAGGTITTGLSSLIDDADADATNEIQDLSSVLSQGNLANSQIKNVIDPTTAQDAATKAYADNLWTSGVSGYEVVTKDVTLPKGATWWTFNVQAPTGKKVIGAGHSCQFVHVTPVQDGPSSDGSYWWFGFVNDFGFDYDISLFVICVNAN